MNNHKHEDCPADRIPALQDLASWFPYCPQEARTEAAELSSNLLLPDGPDLPQVADWPGVIHRAWLGLSESERKIRKHPLASLIAAWQNRPEEVEPERRQRGIVPALAAARTKGRQGNLPEMQAPALPGLVRHEVGYLPGLEPAPRERPALLTLFDRGGGVSHRQGGYAPAEMCIFIEALMSVPTHARNGSLYRVGPFELREIAGDWLQWNSNNYRENDPKSGGALKQALARLRDLGFPLNDRGGFWYPLHVEAVQGWELSDKVSMLASLPGGSGVGPQVDRWVVRALRSHVGAYRAYMALCFDWDRYGATTNPRAPVGHKRHLILPTRPVAKRTEQGYILDARGNIVTGKGGVPVKSPYDPRAILTGKREPNPARDRYPEYDADDLVALCFPDGVFNDKNPSTRRKYRERARRDIKRVESADGCTIEQLGDTPNNNRLPWRIMPNDR